MVLRRLVNSLRLRRMERSGEVLIDAEAFWDSFGTLAENLIPGRDSEISRDLFGILAFEWGVRAEKGVVHDPFDILRHIRDQAWLGYSDMPALLRMTRDAFPESVTRQRLLRYFEELLVKRGTYLFLPIVSRIERHQAGPLPASLQLDTLMEAFEDGQAGSLVRQMFALAPRSMRERNVFLLALLTQSWGQRQVFRDQNQFHGVVAGQLRRLYEHPGQALTAIRTHASTSQRAARVMNAADELATPIGRPPLLEALFITENWIVGPQRFEHAFEIEAARMRDLIQRQCEMAPPSIG